MKSQERIGLRRSATLQIAATLARYISTKNQDLYAGRAVQFAEAVVAAIEAVEEADAAAERAAKASASAAEADAAAGVQQVEPH